MTDVDQRTGVGADHPAVACVLAGPIVGSLPSIKPLADGRFAGVKPDDPHSSIGCQTSPQLDQPYKSQIRHDGRNNVAEEALPLFAL